MEGWVLRVAGGVGQRSEQRVGMTEEEETITVEVVLSVVQMLLVAVLTLVVQMLFVEAMPAAV